jgi:GDP-D-mannose dehydratase
VGNAAKAREQLGWDNEIVFREIVSIVINRNLELFSK